MQRRNRLARESRCAATAAFPSFWRGQKDTAFRENRPPTAVQVRERVKSPTILFSFRCYICGLRYCCNCSEPFVVLAVSMRDVQINEKVYVFFVFCVSLLQLSTFSKCLVCVDV